MSRASFSVPPPPMPHRNLVAIVAEMLALRGPDASSAVDAAADVLRALREAGYSVLPNERWRTGGN
jgi:hypothetical protein